MSTVTNTITPTKSFLDKEGLKSLWNIIKAEISNNIANLNSTAKYEGELISIEIQQGKGLLNETINVDESSLLDIKEKTDLFEVSTDENYNKTINISTPISADSISADSISASNITSTGTIVANDFKTSESNITLSGVSDRIDKIDILITADKETFIDNVTEIIEFFKDVPEGSVGMEIFNQVNANKGDITEIRTDISNLDTKENGEHHHTYTPAGNITLSGILNDGVLKIEAMFTGTENTTSNDGAHNHNVYIKTTNTEN